MDRRWIFGMLATVLVAGQVWAGVGKDHRILSCNIRVDHLPEDKGSGNTWSERKDLCIAVIRSRQPGIICAQEVLRSQMEDLKKALPEFGHFGFEGPEMDAREEGYQGIGKNPIFYSLERYELITAGGFWLSETPHIPSSVSWGALRARHVNWVRLRDRENGKQLRVLNLHLDHGPEEARIAQIRMVLDEAATYPVDFTQFLAGDFNSREDRPIHEVVRKAGWIDCHATAPEPRDNGNTTHSFTGDQGKVQKGAIDFIYGRNSGPVKAWEVIRDSKDGKFPSDHYFVIAVVGP